MVSTAGITPNPDGAHVEVDVAEQCRPCDVRDVVADQRLKKVGVLGCEGDWIVVLVVHLWRSMGIV